MPPPTRYVMKLPLLNGPLNSILYFEAWGNIMNVKYINEIGNPYVPYLIAVVTISMLKLLESNPTAKAVFFNPGHLQQSTFCSSSK